MQGTTDRAGDTFAEQRGVQGFEKTSVRRFDNEPSVPQFAALVETEYRRVTYPFTSLTLSWQNFVPDSAVWLRGESVKKRSLQQRPRDLVLHEGPTLEGSVRFLALLR